MRLTACKNSTNAGEPGINFVGESQILDLVINAVESGDELSVFRVQDDEKPIELVFLTNGAWTALVDAVPMYHSNECLH